MTKELSLPEQQKAALTLHHLSAKKDEQLICWLTELLNHKKTKIEDNKVKIEEIQQINENITKDIYDVDRHIQQILQDTKNSLDIILKKIVSDAGIGPKTRIQLLFENNEPKLILHEQ